MNNRAKLGAAAPFREIEVDGLKLACNDEGAGPAVLCLHAIAHGASDFAALSEHLKDRHRVLALDWPGHGHSGPDRNPAGAARYAEVLAAFMDAAEIEEAVLIGNSIGGAAAILYAHVHPERVRGLVLENPGGLVATSDRVSQLALRAIIGFFRAGARGAWWFPAAYRAYYKRVLQNPQAAEQRVKIAAAGTELVPILVEAWTSFAAPEADIRSIAPTIACPVLAAWAKNDQLVQWKRSEPAVRMFPDVRVELFDAGHAAHLEAPEEFAAAVDRFLAAIGWTTGETAERAAAR
jgi:pimeloyl-ACP methyl ester carboxylesterase